MIIKVITKKWHYITPPVGFRPAQIAYDFQQEFFFEWKNNIIKTNNWQKQCNSLEDCFKAIKGYFYGSQYHIIDFVKMNES